MSAQSNGICCGKCELPSGLPTTSKLQSRVYRHRETCGTVQAVLFGKKVNKNEDGFVANFGNAFGFSARWVHTDRKSQYLFKKQEKIGYIIDNFEWIDTYTPAEQVNVQKYREDWKSRGLLNNELKPF